MFSIDIEFGWCMVKAETNGRIEMKQTDQVFHRVTMAIARINMAVEMPEVVDKSDNMKAADLLVEAQFALTELMNFRNIINTMVDLKSPPIEAAKNFIDGRGE